MADNPEFFHLSEAVSNSLSIEIPVKFGLYTSNRVVRALLMNKYFSNMVLLESTVVVDFKRILHPFWKL
ncbi:hypothetical protein DVR14_00270 (plasmid) [Natrinema thermotolerans]|nr:hypothetical protein DVR14_00270 [Natrinema thermotolerans]